MRGENKNNELKVACSTCSLQEEQHKNNGGSISVIFTSVQILLLVHFVCRFFFLHHHLLFLILLHLLQLLSVSPIRAHNLMIFLVPLSSFFSVHSTQVYRAIKILNNASSSSPFLCSRQAKKIFLCNCDVSASSPFQFPPGAQFG